MAAKCSVRRLSTLRIPARTGLRRGHIKVGSRRRLFVNIYRGLKLIHIMLIRILVLNFGWMWIVRTGFICDGLLTLKQNAIKINYRSNDDCRKKKLRSLVRGAQKATSRSVMLQFEKCQGDCLLFCLCSIFSFNLFDFFRRSKLARRSAQKKNCGRDKNFIITRRVNFVI